MQTFDLVVGRPSALRRLAGTVPGSTIAQQPYLKFYSASQSESVVQENGGTAPSQ